MKLFWLFIHLLGVVLWLGGAFSAMTIGFASRREERASLGVAIRLQASIYRFAIAPGSLLAVVSGLLLTLQMYGSASAVGLSHWLMTMQGAGLFAAIITLVFSVPTSARLTRLDPLGPEGPVFNQLRKRQIRLGMISSALGLLALFSAAMGRS